MSIVIGIDSGISSTKVVGIEHGKQLIGPLSVKPISMGEALEHFIQGNGLSRDDIERIVITGVGALGTKQPVNGMPTSYIDEFKANAIGAQHDCGLRQFIVVSMGSGTSLVRVADGEYKHIGGIGVGGGTLQGLSRLMLGTSDIASVAQLAQQGDVNKVNLTIGEVCDGKIDGLIDEATASLFVKGVNGEATTNDIAAGLIHMVLETIGSAAVLSQLGGGFKDFVLIGNLTRLPACGYIFPLLEKLYGVRFHIPEHADCCTALGAALSQGEYDIEC